MVKPSPRAFGRRYSGIAADGVALSPHLEFQFHEGGGSGLGVLAAEHGPFPDAAAGMVVEGVGDGVEEGGLACAGVAGDEVEAAFAQLGEFQNGLGGIRPKGRQGQFQRASCFVLLPDVLDELLAERRLFVREGLVVLGFVKGSKCSRG